MTRNTIHLILIFFWILLSSFHPAGDIVIPHKKINKTIAKLWKDKQFILEEISGDVSGLCLGNNRLFTVREQTIVLGYIYIGRVNSCRSGGCSVDATDESLEFEYFDYFFVTDATGKVMRVKVFNYRATHGHEIMSRGWLRQFIGYSGEKELIYGKDIEAISGATISANAINDDIQLEVDCLQKCLLDSVVITTN